MGHGDWPCFVKLVQLWVQVHSLDNCQHVILARSDGCEVTAQCLEMRDRVGSILGPIVRYVGRQQRLFQQGLSAGADQELVQSVRAQADL